MLCIAVKSSISSRCVFPMLTKPRIWYKTFSCVCFVGVG